MPSDSPPFFINGVPCFFVVGEDGENPAIVESTSFDNGPVATIVIKCDWLAYPQVRAGLLGTVDYTNGTVAYNPPFRYPIDDSLLARGTFPDRWFCTSIEDVRGLKWVTDQDGNETNTGVAGWGYYREAIITARFTAPLYQLFASTEDRPYGDPSGKAYTITKIKTAGQVFSPPTGSLIYGGGTFTGQALQDIHGAQIRTQTEISYTRVRMPIVPADAIQNCQGGVNDVELKIGSFKYPKGSVLLGGSNSEQKVDPVDFGIVFDVEYTFLANAPTGQDAGVQLDWNFFMDPEGTWVAVNKSGSGAPVFRYVDMSRLFAMTIS